MQGGEGGVQGGEGGGVQGGAIFMIKPKNMRHTEIHVIMMICHIVSEYNA